MPLLIKIGGDDAEPALRKEPYGHADERREPAFKPYPARETGLDDGDEDVDRDEDGKHDEAVYERVKKDLSHHLTTFALPSLTAIILSLPLPPENSVQVRRVCTPLVMSRSIRLLSPSSSLKTSSSKRTGGSPLSFSKSPTSPIFIASAMVRCCPCEANFLPSNPLMTMSMSSR